MTRSTSWVAWPRPRGHARRHRPRLPHASPPDMATRTWPYHPARSITQAGPTKCSGRPLPRPDREDTGSPALDNRDRRVIRPTFLGNPKRSQPSAQAPRRTNRMFNNRRPSAVRPNELDVAPERTRRRVRTNSMAPWERRAGIAEPGWGCLSNPAPNEPKSAAPERTRPRARTNSTPAPNEPNVLPNELGAVPERTRCRAPNEPNVERPSQALVTGRAPNEPNVQQSPAGRPRERPDRVIRDACRTNRIVLWIIIHPI